MSGQVTIIRDAYGVPYIYADDLYDLFFGNGVAIAEDRLFQLEQFRRGARGALAEIMGPSMVAMDIAARRDMYRPEELDALFANLDEEHQTMFRAYVDGINHYIEQAQAGKSRVALDPRVAQLPVPLQPWTVQDTVAATVAFLRACGVYGNTEVNQLKVLRWLQRKFGDEQGQDYFDDIFPFTDPGAPTHIPPEDDMLDASQLERHTHEPYYYDRQQRSMEPAVLEAHEEHLARIAKECKIVSGLGSFGWVVGGPKSESGNAIVVSAPQMGCFKPAFCHQLHLCGAGFDVRGMGYGGVPGVLLGVNRWIAWTGTGGGSAQVDAFYEVLHPDDPTKYLFNGEYRKFVSWVEEIPSLGRSAPIRQRVYHSVHGPVFAFDLKNGVAMAKKSSAHLRELDTWVGWMKTCKARNVYEFDEANGLGTISGHMLCGDCEGNIAYRHIGLMPIRAKGIDRRLPTPGTGEFEWQGMLTPEEMPHYINPKRGQIASWNNKPRHLWPEGKDRGWRRGDHAWALYQVLNSRPSYTLESTRDIKRVFADKHIHEAQYRPFLLNALASHLDEDTRFPAALEHLKNWNGLMEDKDGDNQYDAPGYSIFHEWLRKMQFNTFYPIFEDKYVGVDPYGGGVLMVLMPEGTDAGGSHLMAVLEGDESPLQVKGRYLFHPENGQPMERDEAILRSLKEALDKLAVHFDTTDMTQWLSQVRYFDDGFPFPSVRYRNVGTYEHVIELTPDGPVGYDRLPPGQSDHPESPHINDQHALLANLDHKPLLFKREDVEKNAEVTYTIQVPAIQTE